MAAPGIGLGAKLGNICHPPSLLQCSSPVLLVSAVMADSHQWEMEMEGLQIDIWEVKVIPGRVFSLFLPCIVSCHASAPCPLTEHVFSNQGSWLFSLFVASFSAIHIPFQISIHCEDKFISNVRIAGRKNAMRCQQLWTVFAGNIQSRVISPRNEGNNSPNSPSPLSSTSPSAK